MCVFVRFERASQGHKTPGSPDRTRLDFQLPRLTVWTREHGVGFVAVEFVGLRVPADFLAEAQGNRPDVTDDDRTRADFDVANRFRAGLQAVEEVGHVPAGDGQTRGAFRQGFLYNLLVAGGDLAAADENPLAVLALDLDAVLARARRDHHRAIGVGVGDVKFLVAAIGTRGGIGWSALSFDADRAVSVHVQGPLADIDVVGAPVGHLSARPGVPPAEIVMAIGFEAVLLSAGQVFRFGRGAKPEIPIEFRRRSDGRDGFALRITV